MKTFNQFITDSNGSLKNTHIEHPEDSVLNGDLTVLNWFTENGKISAKIDGAPAIVWGLSLIHISEPTRPERISYAVFC